MNIPYHLQTVELSYGWIKINKQTVDEQGEKTENYTCKLYPPRDSKSQWRVLTNELQLMDFLEENPRIPHNKNELSLNCVPYDPTPLMLEELREQKKHLTEFLSHDQGTVDIITPLSPCLSGIHNPNPGNRDQGSRGTGCGVNLNPSSTYWSAPMKHRSLPQNNNNNTLPTCKGYT